MSKWPIAGQPSFWPMAIGVLKPSFCICLHSAISSSQVPGTVYPFAAKTLFL